MPVMPKLFSGPEFHLWLFKGTCVQELCVELSSGLCVCVELSSGHSGSHQQLVGTSEYVCHEMETASLAQFLTARGQGLAVREEQSPRLALAPRPGTHSSSDSYKHRWHLGQRAAVTPRPV